MHSGISSGQRREELAIDEKRLLRCVTGRLELIKSWHRNFADMH